jgi:hypothetical protein
MTPVTLEPTDYWLFTIYREDPDVTKTHLVHRDHLDALITEAEQQPGVVGTDYQPLAEVIGLVPREVIGPIPRLVSSGD